MRSLLQCASVRSAVWRLPAGEVDRIVVQIFGSALKSASRHTVEQNKDIWLRQLSDTQDIAAALNTMPVSGLRDLFIRHDLQVQVHEDRIALRFKLALDSEPLSIATPARLIRRGHQLRIVLASDANQPGNPPDPHLLKLIAQAFAARDYLLSGASSTLIAQYDRRHQTRLARLAWLAPDIILAIIEGRQPAQLTARNLVRRADLPLDWAQQRSALGFA